MYAQFTRIYPETGYPAHARTSRAMSSSSRTATDAARAQSYVLVHQATEALPLQPIIGGRYYDRFARVDGRWRFTERRMEMDLFGEPERPPAAAVRA